MAFETSQTNSAQFSKEYSSEDYKAICAALDQEKELSAALNKNLSDTSKKCTTLENLLKSAKDLLKKQTNIIYSLTALFGPKKRESIEKIQNSKSDVIEQAKKLIPIIEQMLQSSDLINELAEDPEKAGTQFPPRESGEQKKESGAGENHGPQTEKNSLGEGHDDKEPEAVQKKDNKDEKKDAAGGGEKASGNDTGSDGTTNLSENIKNGEQAESDTDFHQKTASHKGRGNKELKRTSGFILDSFIDKKNTIIQIDPIYMSIEDIMKQLHTDSREKVRFSSDVETYTTSTRIDGRIYPVLHISLKFRNGDETFRNPHNGRPLRASIYSEDVVASMIFNKYNLGLPMNRMEKHLFSMMNLNVQRSTIEEWIRKNYLSTLKFVRYAMLDYMKSRNVLLMDETYVNCKEYSGNSYFWSVCTTNLDPDSLPMCLFIFDESRSAVIPDFYMKGFGGTMLTDGYGGYTAFVKNNKEMIRLASCWNHWRRNLTPCVLSKKVAENYELMNGEKHWAEQIWTLIDHMFFLDKSYKKLSPEERLKKRKEEMLKDALKIKTILEKVREHEITYKINSDVQNAVDFFFEREKDLFRIFEDGRIPLSTNELESMNNMIALGRDNWMAFETGSGSEIGGTLFSLTASARLAGVDVQTYLDFIMETLPYVISQLTSSDLKAITDYYDEFYEKLKQARKEKKKKEKIFHPEEMTHPKPDLTPFYILFPNSEEHKAYAALKEKEGDERHKTIAKAITLQNISKSSINDSQLVIILDTLLKRIENGSLDEEYLGAINDLRNEYILSTPEASLEQTLTAVTNILTLDGLPEEDKEAFIHVKEYLIREVALDGLRKPDFDVRSTSNFVFPEHSQPEYLLDPAGVLERLRKMGYGCLKDDFNTVEEMSNSEDVENIETEMGSDPTADSKPPVPEAYPDLTAVFSEKDQPESIFEEKKFVLFTVYNTDTTILEDKGYSEQGVYEEKKAMPKRPP